MQIPKKHLILQFSMQINLPITSRYLCAQHKLQEVMKGKAIYLIYINSLEHYEL